MNAGVRRPEWSLLRVTHHYINDGHNKSSLFVVELFLFARCCSFALMAWN